MDKIRILFFIVPGSILLIYFLGIQFITYLICAIIFFITGLVFFLMHNGIQKRKALEGELDHLLKSFRFSQGNEEFLKNESRFKDISMYAEKHSMTGSDIIDAILEQILQYIVRDSIDSWYTKLSPNPLFQESLKRTARRTIAAFNHCLKKVDWVPLLTRDFVDDFASHLRLYRKSKEKIQMQKENMLKGEDLASVFFDFELEMEKSYCRDLISTSPPYESAYLHDIVDIILYLLMPSEDFRSRPLRFLLREVFVSKIFVPLLDKFADPFYMNYLIVWLLSELPINTDDFITCLETCQSVQELESILESIHEEINSIKSKDNGGDSESFKQQLTSLEFTESLIKRQMLTLANKPEVVITNNFEIGKEVFPDETMIHLPIMVVLTHSVAISFFVEFLTHVGGLPFIDFYLSIEGFKSSIDHQLRGLASGEVDDSEIHETAKEAALFMYHQYLSQEAITRIPLEDSIINKFLARLRNDEPSDSWFEQIQEKVVEILSRDERFYPSFKKHPLYIRMLEDLGIMGSALEDPENLSCGGAGSEANSESGSCRAKSPSFSIASDSVEPAESGLQTDSTVFWSQTPFSSQCSTDSSENKFITKVLMDTLGVGQQGKQMFALYNVRVFKSDVRSGGKNSSSWNVIRRYSDFHTLNETIISRYPNLKNISFPGKKTFNNLEQVFLEKRCKALNEYMACLLQPNLLSSNPGLEAEIYDFLSQKCYKGNKGERLTKKMTSMFNPILSGVKAFGSAVTSVPDQVFDGMTKVGNELNKAATQVLKSSNSLSGQASSRSTINSLEFKRVAAHLSDTDSNESIPLRVILLFVDEVFGLRGRNQWFRRRLVALLRQFVNAAFGVSINKRIVDAVLWLTSGEQVAQYLIAFKDSMWNESGEIVPNQKNLSPDALRTRFLARCLMLSALPDQLRLFIGTSTTINGINNISEALQNSQLNRRFWYVILERMLVNIFPNNRFEKVLPMLHKKSPRQFC